MTLNEIMTYPQRIKFQGVLDKISRKVVRVFMLKSSIFHSARIHQEWQASAALISITGNPNNDEWDDTLLMSTWPAFLKTQFELAYPEMTVQIIHGSPLEVHDDHGIRSLRVIVQLHPSTT